MALKDDVASFLNEVKAVSAWDKIAFLSRLKNSKDLTDLGITANRRIDVILDLNEDNYSEGPLDETQLGGRAMWVFGKKVNGIEVYIKLTIIITTNKVVCISFHKSQKSMIYPFKN